MYRKVLKYKDFNGNEREEEFLFNLTSTELAEMSFSSKSSYSELIKEIVRTKDYGELIRIFKDILLKSYGEKSPDGKYFMKNDEIREKFSCTQAFSDLFLLFANDDVAAAEFINNIIPEEIKEKTNNEEVTKFELV